MATAASAAKHDDQVDAIGLVGQLLDHIFAGSKPKPEEKRRWPYRAGSGGEQMLSDVPIIELIERQARKRMQD